MRFWIPLFIFTVIYAVPVFLAVSFPVFLLTVTTFGLEDVQDTTRSPAPHLLTFTAAVDLPACIVMFPAVKTSVGFSFAVFWVSA